MRNVVINLFVIAWVAALVSYVYFNFSFYLTRRKKNGGGVSLSGRRPATKKQ
jgi:hypothetical protein